MSAPARETNSGKEKRMPTYKVPQEMKSFWGEFWCGPDEVPENEWTQVALYQRHGRDETAAEVAVKVADDDITYAVWSGGHSVQTPSRVHAADLCRWLQFGEIELVA
jgi:hypothetical protein